MNHDDDQLSKRSMTFIFYNGQEEYQAYSDLKRWYSGIKSKAGVIYQSESSSEQRRIINQQIKEIQSLISGNGITKSELLIQYLPDLFPIESCRLFTIQQLSARILKSVAKSESDLLQKVNKQEIFLSLLTTEQNHTDGYEFLETITTIYDKATNTISTQENVVKIGQYYQDDHATHALVTCLSDKVPSLALIQLRQQPLEALSNGVTQRYLGKTIQKQNNNNVVSLHKVQVLKLFPVDQSIELWKTLTSYEDTVTVLRQLLKLCDIAFKYCSMRTQFKTMDSKSERPIISYQVTMERITSALAFATLNLITTEMNKNEYKLDLINNKDRKTLNKQFADFYTQYIMEQSLKVAELVRETLGGFGFLRFSGAPQVQETIISIMQPYVQGSYLKLNRFLDAILNFDKNKQFVAHFLGQFAIQDPKKMFTELGEFNEVKAANAFHVFGYHAGKVAERLQQKDLLKHTYTMYQLGQMAIELCISQKFFSIIAFKRYRTSNYILDRLLLVQNFQALFMMETDSNNLKLFRASRTQVLQELLPVLHLVVESFEFEQPGVLLGSDNPKQFYEDLLHLSKNVNKRNDPQDLQIIRAPILALLNRPAL